MVKQCEKRVTIPAYILWGSSSRNLSKNRCRHLVHFAACIMIEIIVTAHDIPPTCRLYYIANKVLGFCVPLQLTHMIVFHLLILFDMDTHTHTHTFTGPECCANVCVCVCMNMCFVKIISPWMNFPWEFPLIPLMDNVTSWHAQQNTVLKGIFTDIVAVECNIPPWNLT